MSTAWYFDNQAMSTQSLNTFLYKDSEKVIVP